MGLMKEVLFREMEGYQLYKFQNYPEGVIACISNHNGLSVRLGQLVKSTGHFGVVAGTIGIVTAIHLPYKDGFTSNVISVWFEGQPSNIFVKFGELQL